MILNIRHAGRNIELSGAVPTMTVSQVKTSIEERLGIPVARQQLLAVGKKLTDDSKLCDLGITDGHKLMLVAAAAGIVVPAEQQDEASSSALLSRCQSTQVTNTAGTYTCSYGFGYLAQEAFVCRTCINSKAMDANHILCSSCADVCHENHKIENWGRRVHARCDCATAATTSDEQCCKFVIDGMTREVAKKCKLPRNSKNVYPPNPNEWCFCKLTRETLDDDDDDGCGRNCFVCNQSFWLSHLATNLNTSQLRQAVCYGDVLKGDTLCFECRTCRTWVCWPCAMHCHKDHDISPEFLIPSEEEEHHQQQQRQHDDGDGEEHKKQDGGGQGQGLPESNKRCAEHGKVSFSCGCDKNSCRIMEGVDPSDAQEAIEVPSFIADNLIENDDFLLFVCGRCMQQKPWLLQWPSTVCREGILVDASNSSGSSAANIKPVACSCIELENEAEKAQYYDHCGMLIPETFFSEYVCICDKCTEAFQNAVPGCTEAADQPPELFFEDKSVCSHCGAKTPVVSSGGGGGGGMSGTAAAAGDANAKGTSGEDSTSTATATATALATTYICTTCELTSAPSYHLCEACYNNRATNQAHPLDHDFEPDTFDNMWRLFGAQLVLHVDNTTQQWMIDHWHEAKDAFFDFIRDRYGPKRLREEGNGGEGHQQQQPAQQATATSAAAAAATEPGSKKKESEEKEENATEEPFAEQSDDERPSKKRR